jgi:hypothetical protein
MLSSVHHHIQEQTKSDNAHFAVSMLFFQKLNSVGYIQQAAHHAKNVDCTKYKCNSPWCSTLNISVTTRNSGTEDFN